MGRDRGQVSYKQEIKGKGVKMSFDIQKQILISGKDAEILSFIFTLAHRQIEEIYKNNPSYSSDTLTEAHKSIERLTETESMEQKVK